MTAALALATFLGGLGLLTGWAQIRGMRELKSRKHVPSDESAYLRRRYRLRLLTAVILGLIGMLIAGVYLSGMERRADQLAAPQEDSPEEAEEESTPKPIDPDDKRFVRLWGLCWILIIFLTFLLIVIAIVEGISARLYWMSQYQQLKEDQQAKLRRELAVIRSQKQGGRNRGFGGRLGNGTEPDDEEPSP